MGKMLGFISAYGRLHHKATKSRFVIDTCIGRICTRLSSQGRYRRLYGHDMQALDAKHLCGR